MTGTDRTRLSGSMTVFMGMTLLMILSIFFSLLEVVHYVSLKRQAVMLSQLGTESLFADYCRPLWEEYQVLGIDGGYGSDKLSVPMAEDRVTSYLLDNSMAIEQAPGGNHLLFDAADCELVEYGLLTDDNAAPLIKECAATVMHGIPKGMLDMLQEQSEAFTEEAMDWETQLQDGQDAYLLAKEEQEERAKDAKEDSWSDSGSTYDIGGSWSDGDTYSNGGTWSDDDDAPDTDGNGADINNPIKAVLDWIQTGILSQVNVADVSQKAFLTNERVSMRTLAKSSSKVKMSVSLPERAMFQWYLMDRFSSYTDPKERAGLSYELEYMVSGEKSDKENLAETVEKLLAIRFAMNMAAFSKMSDKQSKAGLVAAGLAGITLSPEAYTAIKAGVIAAWVYTESVLDVRTLLAGEKIALMKTSADWTSQLGTLFTCLSQNTKAKENPAGLDYKTYLGMMLTLVASDSIGYRALDVMENELHNREEYRNVRMDCFLYRATMSYTCYGSPVFGSLVTVAQAPGGYSFPERNTMVYTE